MSVLKEYSHMHMYIKSITLLLIISVAGDKIHSIFAQNQNTIIGITSGGDFLIASMNRSDNYSHK